MVFHPEIEGKQDLSRGLRLKEKFFSSFKEEDQQFAAELLELGRASYRLRDDDNIYLGKIEVELKRAFSEGKKRLMEKGLKKIEFIKIEDFYKPEYRQEFIKSLQDPAYIPEWKTSAKESEEFHEELKPRQLLGNPSSKGMAKGHARVILKESDLFKVKAGEVLVCDAIDPNMTFVVPLCSGIVERRGGLLIHGAIIAREYAIPCVTGISDATHLIKSGDYLTVDGFLGIVTVIKKKKSESRRNNKYLL